VTSEVLKAMTIKQLLLYTRRRAVWHIFTSLSGKIVSCIFSKPHASGSYIWNRSKGCEMASGKGTECPIRLLAAPVPLLPSTSTNVSPCGYSSTMKKEAMSSFETLISISQTTRHTPQDNTSQE